MKEGICTGIGVVGSVIASLFGGWDAALVTLMIFMGIDYITGLIVPEYFTIPKKQRTGHWKAVQDGRGFAVRV